MLNLEKNKKYLLACSYGPDSMYLFDLLYKNGYDFQVAHVNYGLREECFQETKDLIDYCNVRNIKIHVLNATVSSGKNVESECRNIRYEYFSILVKKFHFDEVLVAHHFDDLLETYLIQKERNNKVVYFGLKDTICIKNVQIRRPIIFVKKFQILEYLYKNSIPFAIDSSNLTDSFLRNKIRHSIIEKMSDREKENLYLEIQNRNKQLEEIRVKISMSDLDDVNTLLKFNDFEFPYALHAKINEFIENFDISSGFCSEIKKILLSKKSNVEVKLTDNVSLIKTYGELKVIDLARYQPYEYRINSPLIIDNERLFFDGCSDTSNRNIYSRDYPLTIRNILPSDLIQVGNNVVTGRRVMIDWKLPLHLRRVWPVFINKDGKIIYCPRYRKDFKKDSALNLYVKY